MATTNRFKCPHHRGNPSKWSQLLTMQFSQMRMKKYRSACIVHGKIGDTKGDSLERFTEIIMFGVAMIAIWIGLLGIAFSDNVGEEKFMILSLEVLLLQLQLCSWLNCKQKRTNINSHLTKLSPRRFVLFHGSWDTLGPPFP